MTKNSRADDCRCSVDLSSIAVTPFYGIWEKSDKESIPIAHPELVNLFTKPEVITEGQTTTIIIFHIRTKTDIKIANRSFSTELIDKKIKLSIQSNNADFANAHLRY